VAAVSPTWRRTRRALGQRHVQGEAVRHELRPAMKRARPRLRDGHDPGGQGHPAEGQRGRPHRRRRGGSRWRRREGLRRGGGRARGHVLLPRSHPLAARDPRCRRSWEATSSRSTPRRRPSSPSARCGRGARHRPPKNVRVLCEHMGGGFGSKLGPSATGSAFQRGGLPPSRRRPGRPVKLMLDRKQEQLCTGNAPSALMTVKVGAKKDGTITAGGLQAWGSAASPAARGPRPRRRPPRQDPN